jgi:hypothetical protein
MLLEGVVPAAGDSSESPSIHVEDLKGIVATGTGRWEFVVPVVLVPNGVVPAEPEAHLGC